MRWKDITGLRFGMLVALAPTGVPSRHTSRAFDWYFQCDCGNFCIKRGDDVRRRKNPHCGCQNSILPGTSRPETGTYARHGRSAHPLYRVWNTMKSRCSNPNTKEYKNYGERGIKVCPEWETSFGAFWADMEATYSPGLELDRIDNNQGYSPENCRWVSHIQNARNKRTNRIIETPWGNLTLAEAAEKCGLSSTTIAKRISCGWSSTAAVTTPPQTHKGA